MLLLWSAARADRQVTRPSFFSPMVFTTLLFVLGYVWRPLLHLSDPDRYSAYPEALVSLSIEKVFGLICAAIVGIFFLHVGFRMRAGPRLAKAVPELEWRDWRLNALLFAVLLAAIALLFQQFIGSLGALRFFDMSARQSVMSNFKGSGPTFFLFFNMSTFSCFCALIFLDLRGRAPAAARALFAAFAVLFYVGGLFFAVITASRAPLIAILLLPILLWHYQVRRVPIGTQIGVMTIMLVGGGIVGLLMVSPAAAVAGVTPDINAGSVVARLSGTLDQFELLYIAATQSKTYLLGLSYVQDIFLTYVPRAIFPDKPEIYGTVLLQNILIPSRFETASLSATYPVGFFAEAYMNFGPAGLIIVPFLYGIFLRILAEKAVNGPAPYAFFLLISLAGTVGVLRSAGGQLGSLVFLFGVLLVFSRLSRGLWRLSNDAASRRGTGVEGLDPAKV